MTICLVNTTEGSTQRLLTKPLNKICSANTYLEHVYSSTFDLPSSFLDAKAALCFKNPVITAPTVDTAIVPATQS